MRSMDARLVDPSAPAGKFRPYFAWTASDADFAYINFAIGDTTGLSWKQCNAVKVPIDQSGGRFQAFAVADNDDAGNVYIAYADQNEGAETFHTYLTSIHHQDLSKCGEDQSQLPQANPGFGAPVQVDRGNVRTTVFPWLVARGEPGRVAVSFYGTETQGNPNTGAFKAQLGRLRQPVARRPRPEPGDQPGQGDDASLALRLGVPQRARLRPRDAARRPVARRLLRDRLEPEDGQAAARPQPDQQEARRGHRPHRDTDGRHPERRPEQPGRRDVDRGQADRADLVGGPHRRRARELLRSQRDAAQRRAAHPGPGQRAGHGLPVGATSARTPTAGSA